MKQLIPLLLLFLNITGNLEAQGICDSTITISNIPNLCQGADNYYISVSHSGGVFSGPGLSNTSSPILNLENIPAGFQTAVYTVIGPGGCTNTATRNFIVRDAEEATTMVNGAIDCTDPGSTAVVQAATNNNNQYLSANWSGPQGASLIANGWSATTNMAGRYRFKALPFNQGACPAYGYQDVAFINAPSSLAIENCTNCAENNGHPTLRLKLNPVPPNWQASLKTPNGVGSIIVDGNCNPLQYGAVGLWTAEIKNLQNGCRVSTSAIINPITSVPSVSSGSNLGFFCGFVGHFISAMSPQSALGIDYFWTTPDGSIIPATYGSPCPAPIPGMYILHGLNTFTGCESRDTSLAIAAPTPVSTSIQVICDGGNYLGYTQSGNYVDTILQANGCPRIRKLKLIKLAPLEDSAEVTPDQGQMDGSIQYTVTQGWPPYSYSWSTGETSASILNLSAGTYTVSVTDANDCEHVREIVVPTNKPIRPLSKFRDAPLVLKTILYPNPVPAGLVQPSLDIYASQACKAQLLLNDALGRNLDSKDIQIQEGNNIIPIAKNLTEGVYFLLIKGDFGTKAVAKLLVTEDN